jgi:hypothetical protein
MRNVPPPFGIRPRQATELLRRLRSTSRVAGITHTYYRYPARSDPSFVRAAIEALTDPGDIVMDPFMGGGTSAVEALASGRRFVGTDLNPLSRFITDVKTTPLSESDRSILLDWASRKGQATTSSGVGADESEWRHVPWWLRRAISRLVESARTLSIPRQERFARCTILRTAQWALDGRRSLPTTAQFLRTHYALATDMVLRSLPAPAGIRPGALSSGEPSRLLLERSVIGIERIPGIVQDWTPVRLVLTSPPYPGVHVLYHRWQVKGRRETALPYLIAGLQNGFPESKFTFGPRHDPELRHYLPKYSEAFASIVNTLDRDSLIVQLLGFSNPKTQLPLILNALHGLGLDEVDFVYAGPGSGRAWRHVPNRKWHANLQQGEGGSEVLLVHRLAS